MCKYGEISPDIKPTGFLSDGANSRFKTRIENQCESSSKFARQVSTGLTAGLIIPTLLVTRIFDLLIGLLAVPLAIITLGQIKPLNAFVIRQVKAYEFKNDLKYAFQTLANPSGEESPYCSYVTEVN